MHFTPYGGGEEVTSPTVERCFEAAVFGGQTLEAGGGVVLFYIGGSPTLKCYISAIK